MKADFKTIVNRLACPDDGGDFELLPSAFRCRECLRQFPILGDNLAEILPLTPKTLPASVSEEYRCGYTALFAEKISFASEVPAWGAEERVPRKWAEVRRRQVSLTQKMIWRADAMNLVACDISAGAGYYTFEYAKLFGVVLHCDLSPENLMYSWRRAKANKTENVLFLRTDYFALPFRKSLDRIICMDTLIRGPEHDAMLLAEISAALRPSGLAVVDFHNWWHNPARRIGLLKQNFRHNRSYTRSEASRLISAVDDLQWDCVPFHQEFSADNGVLRLLAKLVPSTRFLFALRERNDSPPHSQQDDAVGAELARIGGGR